MKHLALKKMSGAAQPLSVRVLTEQERMLGEVINRNLHETRTSAFKPLRLLKSLGFDGWQRTVAASEKHQVLPRQFVVLTH